MTAPASVQGSERLRLFCALLLPEQALDAIERWQPVLGGTGRPVTRGNLHVTLAFLGQRPASEVGAILEELRAAAAVAQRPSLAVRGWRETRSVGMLVLDDATGAATRLAEDVQARLEHLGVYRREQRPWLPHITVLRYRERPRLRPELPAVAPFSPSDAAVYLSRLRPGGAQYEVLESVHLGSKV